MECPKSLITGQSIAWLEQFEVMKRFGRPDGRRIPARDAEAMLILEREARSEASNGTQ
jgi:hypothetical protein